jgi:hypothetical protein
MVGTNDVALLAPARRVARMKQQGDAVSRLRFRLICSMALGCMLAGPALAQTDAPATPSAAPAVAAGTPSPSDTSSASQTLAAQGITDVLALQRGYPSASDASQSTDGR